jgi:hypothetical protein
MSQAEMQAAFAELVPELARWWSGRSAKRAAAAAATLGFWPDGMLKQLKRIAEGNASAADFEELRREFRETRGPVEKIIKELG